MPPRLRLPRRFPPNLPPQRRAQRHLRPPRNLRRRDACGRNPLSSKPMSRPASCRPWPTACPRCLGSSTSKRWDARSGEPGGTWRMLMGDQRDLRMMTVYSYTRLVVFDDKLNLVPDILQSLDNQDDKVFTLHLREGHKWSDGEPFTAEDFRYYWDDVANNAKLSPSGPNLALAGRRQAAEVRGARSADRALQLGSIRTPASSAGDRGRPADLHLHAGALPQAVQRHLRGQDELDQMVKSAKVPNWAALHERKSRQYRPENPDLPTLDPWVNHTAPPAELFRFDRNPYFHRVDTAGHQLPYFDHATMTLGTTNLIPAKVAAGESGSPGPLSQLRRLYVPQSRRAEERLHRSALGAGSRRLRGSLSEFDRERPRLARPDARCPVPPCPVARASTGTTSTT